MTLVPGGCIMHRASHMQASFAFATVHGGGEEAFAVPAWPKPGMDNGELLPSCF